MKKLIVGVILLAALLLAGLRLRSLFDFDEKNYTSEETIKHLQIDDKDTSIEVIGTDDSSINIRYTESSSYKYTFSEQNGSLVVKKKGKAKSFWPFNQGFSFFRDDTVRVEVPQTTLDKLVLTTSNSDISVENLTTDIGELKTTNDEITLEDISFDQKLTARTTNGEINLDSVSAKAAKLNTTNDTINLDDLNVQNTLTAKTTNGDISLGTARANRATLTTTNDSISFDNLDVKDSLSAATTNGSVEGTILGSKSDFNIDSHTTNGENSLRNASDNGRKSLEITTTNDDIDVEFDD